MTRKKWMICLLSQWLLFYGIGAKTMVLQANERENIDLYARAAVLMDADSGRILYGKEENLVLPMASTTKIMTCILALEKGNMDDMVVVSDYAASMPKVHLGMRAGEQYKLEDLLYSLMLESHNDSAVAIAEAIAGDVSHFAELMNEKAKEIGCESTFFITPNGLDASIQTEDGEKIHSTTAADLARIMRYCIMQSAQKENFFRITQTAQKSFSNVEQTRTFHCTNHNAFLHMMEGVLSGKTGFTGNAGYCYVCALRRDDRTYIVALLACGWPNHKTYKWQDTRKLMEHGIAQYSYQLFSPAFQGEMVKVNGGLGENGNPFLEQKVRCHANFDQETIQMLMRDGEKLSLQVKYDKEVDAPISTDAPIGQARIILEGYDRKKYRIKETGIYLEKSVEERKFIHYLLYIGKMYIGENK